MVKFKVLKYLDFALEKLITYPLISYYVLLNLIAFIASSIVFVYQNISHYDIALRACLFIFGVSQTVGMFYSYKTNLNRIQDVHSQLNEIVDKSAEGKFYI